MCRVIRQVTRVTRKFGLPNCRVPNTAIFSYIFDLRGVVVTTGITINADFKMFNIFFNSEKALHK